MLIIASLFSSGSERAAKLATLFESQIYHVCNYLLRSEARYFEDYLALAKKIAGEDISERVAFFGEVEAKLISTPDEDFKFHSGVPV